LFLYPCIEQWCAKWVFRAIKADQTAAGGIAITAAAMQMHEADDSFAALVQAWARHANEYEQNCRH
jgi:hypothetical protein